MASITDEIYNIKCALKDVLMQMGGEAAINDFGKKYIKIYGKINLKVCLRSLDLYWMLIYL